MTEELPICGFCSWQGVLVGSRAGEKESYMRSGHALLPAAISTVQPLLDNMKLDCVKGGGDRSPIPATFQEAEVGDHKFKPNWAAE